MIVVRIEVVSARTGKVEEIGRMYLVNDGDRSKNTGGKRGD